MRLFPRAALATTLAAALAACAAPDGTAPALDRPGTSFAALDPQDDGANPNLAQVASIADRVNARLERSGSPYRLDEAWFFMVGRGTDPYRRLRTGSRWNDPAHVTYAIDEPDVIAAPTKAATIAAIARSWEVWNTLGTTLHLERVSSRVRNPDALDGIIRDASGTCIDIVDLKSPVVTSYDPKTGALGLAPVADNVFGGWLAPEYFADCLGSANIIGVTWSFSRGDTNGDNYADRAYTEMYYNTRFQWVTSGSPFLSDIMDVASIVTHEAGHAQGLGHFGGPNLYEPFKLQPNGKVFDPEAVMNPYYIGGDKRDPFPTDVSALQTLYNQNNK